MTWEGFIWKVAITLVGLALAGLGGVVLRLWKGFNPAQHAQMLTDQGTRLGHCEDAIKEGRGHGERLARLEEKVQHVKEGVESVRTDTGSMKIAMDELLRRVRGE
jgi:hypothetical protein